MSDNPYPRLTKKQKRRRVKRGERCYCQLTEQEGGPPNERIGLYPHVCEWCGRGHDGADDHVLRKLLDASNARKDYRDERDALIVERAQFLSRLSSAQSENDRLEEKIQNQKAELGRLSASVSYLKAKLAEAEKSLATDATASDFDELARYRALAKEWTEDGPEGLAEVISGYDRDVQVEYVKYVNLLDDLRRIVNDAERDS